MASKEAGRLGMKERDSVLVHGYIREQFQILNMNIPKEVIELFVKWYHNPLYFVKISQGQELLHDDQTIIKQISDNETAWGSILMSSTGQMIYEYTIKTLADTEYACNGFAIGIDEDGYECINSWFVQQKRSIHYAMQCWDGCKDCKGATFMDYAPNRSVKSGTIIRMIYNSGKRTLSFVVDDKNHGVAFDSVAAREDLNYRLAIYLNRGASVELLGISITNAS